MPIHLIDEPTPFASLDEWLAFRDDMRALPADQPNVAAALELADRMIAELEGEGRGAAETKTSDETKMPRLMVQSSSLLIESITLH